MNATYVFEKGIPQSSTHAYEEDLARRWWALPPNVNLPLTNGESCQLIYAGRPGGSPGPDIRDAILNFTSFRSGTECAFANNRLENTTGDVEIHIRARRHCALPLSALRALLEKLHTPTREPD